MRDNGEVLLESFKKISYIARFLGRVVYCRIMEAI